jgi:hypothetical protein
MHWIAPSEKETTAAAHEARLWETANRFPANSGLRAGGEFNTLACIIQHRLSQIAAGAEL